MSSRLSINKEIFVNFNKSTLFTQTLNFSMNKQNQQYQYQPGAQLEEVGRRGRAPPPAFYTLAMDMSLNRGAKHLTLGIWPCIILSFLLQIYRCPPSQNLPSCAPDFEPSSYLIPKGLASPNYVTLCLELPSMESRRLRLPQR